MTDAAATGRGSTDALRQALARGPGGRTADDDEMLWRLRGVPVAGKCVIARDPEGRGWVLAVLPADPLGRIVLLRDRVFADVAAAELALLAERLAALP